MQPTDRRVQLAIVFRIDHVDDTSRVVVGQIVMNVARAWLQRLQMDSDDTQLGLGLSVELDGRDTIDLWTALSTAALGGLADFKG